MLSSGQREDFHRRGLVRLPDAIPRPEVECMRDRLWDFLAGEHGIQRDDPGSWQVERPSHFQALARSGAFDPMATDQVCAALDELLGPDGWQRPGAWGRPLVTFPQPGTTTWEVPTTGWHIDSQVGNALEPPGVTVFAFLAPVLPQGGGTVVLTGSHRLIAGRLSTDTGSRSGELKAALGSASPWLRSLWGKRSDRVRRYLHDGTTVDRVPLRVDELTGSPGEVVLMHSRLLHAPAPNCRNAPRLMLVNITGRRPSA